MFIQLLLFGSRFGNRNYDNEIEYNLRIVGGAPTDIAQHPYQVALIYNGRHGCGGSIMSASWALTAAHCVFNRDQRALRVRSGSSYSGSGGTLHEITKIITHPRYQRPTVDFDVAVIQVSNPFVYSNKVKPVTLTSQEPSSGTPVTVSGWGRLSHNGSSPIILHSVQINIVDRMECARRYMQAQLKITERMICAKAPDKDVCFGDSGGPLVANGKLVGVVSWGHGCADYFYPAVYANVAVLNSWINSNMRSTK